MESNGKSQLTEDINTLEEKMRIARNLHDGYRRDYINTGCQDPHNVSMLRSAIHDVTDWICQMRICICENAYSALDPTTSESITILEHPTVVDAYETLVKALDADTTILFLWIGELIEDARTDRIKMLNR